VNALPDDSSGVSAENGAGFGSHRFCALSGINTTGGTDALGASVYPVDSSNGYSDWWVIVQDAVAWVEVTCLD
jgi:hypothetical protein